MRARVAVRGTGKPAGSGDCRTGPLYASRRARLDAAIAGRAVALPHRSVLERSFGRPLHGVPVHCDDSSRAALEELRAEAAAYRGHILLATLAAPVSTVAHEVTHVLQAQPGWGPEGVDLAPAPAEREADTIAARAEARAADGRDPPAFVPLRPEIRLTAGALALLRMTSRSSPVAPRPTPRPAPSSAPIAAAGPLVTAAPERTAAPVEAGSAISTDQATGPLPGTAPVEAAAEPAPAPTPGITENEVAARERALEEARARVVEAGSAAGVVEAFADAPPTLKAEVAGELDARLNDAFQQESQALAGETPPVEARIEHDDTVVAGSEQVVAPPLGAVTLEPAVPPPATGAEVEAAPQPPVADPNRGVADRIAIPEGSAEGRGNAVGEALRDVQTTNPGIQASVGPPPEVPLEGEQDPGRIENQAAAGRGLVQGGFEQARDAVVDGPGPERVQPASMVASAPVGEIPGVAVEPAPAPEGAQQYLAMNLPPQVQAAFDEANGERMRVSVADAQGQIQAAADQRDAQHRAAVDQASADRDAAVDEAERSQQARVADARLDIDRERDATIAAQQQAVDRSTQEGDARRETDRSQIDARVADDRRRIETRYADADVAAQREVDAGEREAEGRRQQAERDAEEQSWWDRAVNFVRDAFNSLVSAIGAIFDAVRRAVNGILDAARAFATALIDAAAGFIRDAIAAFGRFLTSLVTTLLGSLFPELAARLTAFINRAVAAAQAAISAVAARLRSAVDAVVGALRRGINALIDAYQAAVNVAVGVLRAVVTGDWAALARQVFEAVLRALGIDPASIYQFVGRSEATLQAIIDAPGAFLGRVVDALAGGIDRFATNFLSHLQAGIIGWLTGALGGAGITLPERFDLAGVLSLVQQVLGLTWANLRERIARVVGERAEQALEFVASYVQTLVEGGWAALWDRLQNDLATLRDMLLEQVRSFLVERILRAAITRLATMFSPVGALLNLVLALYNFYTFLRDQLQRIFAVAQAIVNAVSDIARGVLEPATQRVESVLSSLLPLAIDLLARLIGLGDVGERVRAILQGVQQTIWGAIDRLIERVLASFRGRGPQAAAGVAASGDAGQPPDEPFQLGRESHTLRARIQPRRVSILMASGEFGELAQRVANIRQSYIATPANPEAVYPSDSDTGRRLEARLQQIETTARQVVDETLAEPDETRRIPILNAGLDRIEALFVELGGFPFRVELEGHWRRPEHRYSAASVDGFGRATAALGDPISRVSRDRGSAASVDPPGIRLIALPYERGHLLARALGGPGNDRANLAPVSAGTNKAMRDGPEKQARDAIYDSSASFPNLLRYTARCRYRPSGGLQQWLGGLGAAPNAETRLFALASANAALDEGALHTALGGPAALPLSVVAANADQIRRKLAFFFMPQQILVRVEVLAGPAVVAPSHSVSNHMGVTP